MLKSFMPFQCELTPKDISAGASVQVVLCSCQCLFFPLSTLPWIAHVTLARQYLPLITPTCARHGNSSVVEIFENFGR